MNDKQVVLLKQSVQEFNKMREDPNELIDLWGADLSRADLRGADLRDADLRDTDLWGADLRGADLREAKFIGADLRGADFRGADLTEANFIGANLRGAKLRGADLTEADFIGANLWRADFTGADLTGADLTGAHLWRADLTEAKLLNAKLPSPQMVLSANWGECSDELTLQLMRYDAASHPDPKAFTEWANGGECPYDSCKVERAANFLQKKELWSPGPVESTYTLMEKVLKEHCIGWDE